MSSSTSAAATGSKPLSLHAALPILPEIPLAIRANQLWGDIQTKLDIGFRRTGMLYLQENEADAASHQAWIDSAKARSEEHTSELQSRERLVCRLLLEKKKNLYRKGA